MITIEIVAPKDLKKGETFTAEVELPEKVKKPRGVLAGLALADMDNDQLKREIINANSVLYKAKQRGADDAIITANQARVNAALAEKAKRQPPVAAVVEPKTADKATKSKEPAGEKLSDEI